MSHRSFFGLFLRGVFCISRVGIFALAFTGPQVSAEQVRQNQEELPELFITANRVETPLENIGRSVAVIDCETIDTYKSLSVTDALQAVSGLRLQDLGGPGSPGVTPIEIRGFRTSGTQLLLDGMNLSDPSSIAGTYESFFSYLTTDDLASIEVLKGGTGVLYGSDGQAGAINLIPLKPTEGLFAQGRIEGGSYDTLTESALVNAGNDLGGVVGSVMRVDSQGLDTHGDYDNTTVMLNGSYSPIPGTLIIEPLLRHISGSTDLDTDPTLDPSGELITNLDTERNNVQVNGTFAAVTAKYSPLDWWQTATSIYTNINERDFFFDFDGFESTSDLAGRTFNTELQNTFRLADLGTNIVFGLEFERQESESTNDGTTDKASRNQYGTYLHASSTFFGDTLTIAEGVRLTEISEIDRTVTTLEGSGVFQLPLLNSRLHSSVAQGFRAPTLFETEGTIVDFSTGELVAVGSQELEAEETLSFDAGYEQLIWGDALKADITVFQIDADQTIVFDFANLTHLNGGGGKTQGIESSFTFAPCDGVQLRAAYTNLDRAQGRDGIRRQRTPRNWFTVGAAGTYRDLTLSAELRYRDSQEIEFFGIEERFEESGATLLDASVTYRGLNPVDLYLRADNVFDEDYTESGFRMPGASIYAGLRFRIG